MEQRKHTEHTAMKGPTHAPNSPGEPDLFCQGRAYVEYDRYADVLRSHAALVAELLECREMLSAFSADSRVPRAPWAEKQED